MTIKGFEELEVEDYLKEKKGECCPDIYKEEHNILYAAQLGDALKTVLMRMHEYDEETNQIKEDK